MLQQLIGPIANLAGSYLQGKADKATANAKLKLVEAESKAAILMSKETSTADWERIMAESTKNSWKDEFITIVVMIPVILCFVPGLEDVVKNGFDRSRIFFRVFANNFSCVICRKVIANYKFQVCIVLGENGFDRRCNILFMVVCRHEYRYERQLRLHVAPSQSGKATIDMAIDRVTILVQLQTPWTRIFVTFLTTIHNRQSRSIYPLQEGIADHNF